MVLTRHDFPEPEDTWQPGQYIPQSSEPSPPPPPPDFYSLLVQMKNSISTQIQQVQTSVDSLSGRVDKLEQKMSGAAERIRLSETSLSSSSSPSSEPSYGVGQRKRRISTDLAVSFSTNMYVMSIYPISYLECCADSAQ